MFRIKRFKGSAVDFLDRTFRIGSSFRQFNQKNDIFSRAVWDEKINPKHFFKSYDVANYVPKKSKGFDHWDYAFRNASWHLTDVVAELKWESEGKVEGFTDYYSIQTEGPREKAPVLDSAETSRRIKLAARTLGAGAVGICEVDRRWLYSHHFKRKQSAAAELDFPSHLKYAIILVLPMDYDLTRTIPSAVGGTTTGLGYAASLNAANALAQFIVNLGYEAIASLNDTALSIPMAIQAGLGEYGRNGLLITPEFGPNVRIAKVFTDLALQTDHPISFGVKEFCEVCRKCSDNCPVKAIPAGPPQEVPPNFSSHRKVRKWTVNAEKCFRFWVGMNTDCAICIRVCPFNKDYRKWWNKIGLRLANSPLRRWMLRLDNWLQFGKRIPPGQWWNKGNITE